jgi:hypothetical protein
MLSQLRLFNTVSDSSHAKPPWNMAGTKCDNESRSEPLLGYPSLANFIASDRDRTTLIYNRYDELAARNLLYLQSELAELQAQQRRFDHEDIRADLPTKQCARNFSNFKDAGSDTASNVHQKERWALMLQIRATMKEYRDALQSEITLAALPRPSKEVLSAFHTAVYTRSKPDGELFPTLGGYSAGLYDDIDDLVALRVQEDSDRLTNLVRKRLAFLFPVSEFRCALGF